MLNFPQLLILEVLHIYQCMTSQEFFIWHLKLTTRWLGTGELWRVEERSRKQRPVRHYQQANIHLACVKLMQQLGGLHKITKIRLQSSPSRTQLYPKWQDSGKLQILLKEIVYTFCNYMDYFFQLTWSFGQFE